MPTSSFDVHLVIKDKEAAERFIEAIEESRVNQKELPVPDYRLLTDPEEIHEAVERMLRVANKK